MKSFFIRQFRNVRLLASIFLLPTGSVTFAQDASPTIAILGCHKQHLPAPTLPYLADVVKPDFCIWLGDNVYADTKKDPDYIRQQLEFMAGKEGFQELKENSKFYVTWDDHDYGSNNAGKFYPLKEQSKQIHRKFWNLENEIPADHDGVYYAGIETLHQGKKVQFIMLDGRFNRDNPGPGADALGPNQWKWLESQLKEPADLRLIVSGYQVLLNRPTRWESWVKLGKSRQRLFDLIRDTGAKGVVFVTGDQHYAEVLKTPAVLGYDAYEILAAGINNAELPGRASNRVIGPDLTEHSAALVRIYWEGKGEMGPHLEFTITDVISGKVNLEYRILLSDIGL